MDVIAAKVESALARKELRLKTAMYLRTSDAATICGVERLYFKRHVAPHLKPRCLTRPDRRGRMPRRFLLWRREELIAWIEQHKVEEVHASS